MTSARAQSNQATAPSISGLPEVAACQATAENLSARFEAKTPDMSFWLSARIFTAKPCAAVKVAQLDAALAMQTRSNGGSSETDVKELAVKPRGAPSASMVVTMVTPVMNAPKATQNHQLLSHVMHWLTTTDGVGE